MKRSLKRRFDLGRWLRLLLVAALLVAPLPIVPALVEGGVATPRTAPVAAVEGGEDGDVCDAVVPPQGPAWSDANGWNSPGYYTTIRLADVDGGGRAELIARGSDGLNVNFFDVASGRWVARENKSRLLSDADGWNHPEYYETIRFAHIDGSRAAALLVRGRDGILTYKYNAQTDQWAQLGTPVKFFSGSAWTDPKYYSTIRLADLDDDGQAELIGRGAEGVAVFRWNKSTSDWQTLTTSGPLSDAEGWDSAEYYETIQFADVDGNGSAELLARSKGGIVTYCWREIDEGNVVDRFWDQIGPATGVFADEYWRQAKYYKTIQAADIDGDRAAELIGRAGGGIVTFRWNRTFWEQIGQPDNVAGDDAWTAPERYSTIQLADLDGNKKTELIGRARGGIVAFRWDQAAGAWKQIALPTLVMSDAAGWSKPDQYQTLRLGDLDGDGAAELVGRSAKQIETWRFNGEEKRFRPVLTPGFPALNSGQQAAYRYISQALLERPDDGNADIRSEYSNQALTQDFNGRYLFCLNGSPCGFSGQPLTRPEGVSEGDWEAVKNQLRTEFKYVVDVNSWFAQNDKFLDKLASEKILIVDFVRGRLALSEEDVSLDVAKLVTSFVTAIASLVGAEKVAAVGEIIATSIEAGALTAAGGAAELQKKAVEIQGELKEQILSAQKANDCNLKYHMQNWGLMQSLGTQIVQARVKWDDTLTSQLLEEGTRAYELYIWQTLTPLAWEIHPSADCGGLVGLSCHLDNFPQEYFYVDPNDRSRVPDEYFVVKQERGGWYFPVEDLGYLFSNLGVKKAALYSGQNGWNLPGSVRPRASAVKSGPHCSPFCFRAAQFYASRVDRLPQGAVFTAGSIFNNPVNTNNTAAMRLLLQGHGLGQFSALQRFNQQYVAAQLNLLATPGPDADAHSNELTCYKVRFTPVRLSNNVSLTVASSLEQLLEQAHQAARNGSAADQQALADILGQLNGNYPFGRCNLAALPRAPVIPSFHAETVQNQR